MAKYEHFNIKFKDNKELDYSGLKPKQHEKLENGDVVYIYRSSSSKNIYIGQTTQFKTRHRQHFSGNEEKFNTAKFDQVKILISQYFNKSALIDVEKQLITYFMADNPNLKSKKVLYDNHVIINQNSGNNVNNYANREKVSSEVILPFWEEVLFPQEWVKTPSIEKLRASALVKYSPIKLLTEEQEGLIQEIYSNPNKNYVINGDAGTGKTVLLTHLVAKYISENQNKKIAVIVQPNWEKTAKEIFNVFGIQSKALNVTTSTKFITQAKEYDVVIVDESHKLSRKGPKQQPSFNQVYKKKEFSNCENHLEAIKILGKQIILMYDVLQAIRPANIAREKFRELTTAFEKRSLSTQFRIQPLKGKNYSSDDYINGIKYLLYKDTYLKDYINLNENFNKSLFKEEDVDAYFGYFEEEPLKNMIDWLDEDKNYHPEHVNRVLSGLVEDWKPTDGQNIEIHHFKEGNISRRWNSNQKDWLNSNDVDAEEQIGSIFAVQGLDLNKVGVLIGNDLLVDDSGKLYGEPDNFKNVYGKHTKKELELPETQEEFTIFVLNIYYVLLTRAIDGVRIGFWKNDAFKQYFKEVFDII